MIGNLARIHIHACVKVSSVVHLGIIRFHVHVWALMRTLDLFRTSVGYHTDILHFAAWGWATLGSALITIIIKIM